MSQGGNRSEIPVELQQLLGDFTACCLNERPTNLITFATNYFAELGQRQEASADGVLHSNGPAPESEDSILVEEIDETRPESLTNLLIRRKTVFAESYDPEGDDDDVEKVVYPKSDQQRQMLAEKVKNIFIFRSLNQKQIDDVLDAMVERKVECGECVIRQGDDGGDFYVIDSGIYHVFVASHLKLPPRQVGHYVGSGSFGELALMYNMPRSATVQAVTQGSLWVMDRSTFRRIVLKIACKQLKMYESLLETVPMLRTLTAYERMSLANALSPRQFEDEACIIRQGDVSDGMYFVEAGTVRITALNDNGVEVEISRVNSGGCIGELALVTRRRRAASAYSVGPVCLAFLDLETFERLLGPCINIMKRNIDEYEKCQKIQHERK